VESKKPNIREITRDEESIYTMKNEATNEIATLRN
jgi:hypothetical protein